MARNAERRGFLGRLIRFLVLVVLIFGVLGPIAVVALYRFVPPPLTFLMVQRAFEGQGFSRDWVPLEEINPRLVRAVIAAEDARFCEHQGFDFDAIEKALQSNKKTPGRIRGGSTISQQTAKNVFLWPHRDWVRKGLEAYFTVLIEVGWGKRRIMEVYLNSIEFGPGVYGAEAAARKHFGVSAKDLTANQAARLAAVLPNPLEWRADGARARGRSRRISANAAIVRRSGYAACVLESRAAAAPEPSEPAKAKAKRQLPVQVEPEAPLVLPEATEVAPDPAPAPAPEAPPEPQPEPLPTEPAAPAPEAAPPF